MVLCELSAVTLDDAFGLIVRWKALFGVLHLPDWFSTVIPACESNTYRPGHPTCCMCLCLVPTCVSL